MDFTLIMFAYLSPETVLPVTSILATVAGLVLMFGKNTITLACSLVSSCDEPEDAWSETWGPHVRPAGSA